MTDLSNANNIQEALLKDIRKTKPLKRIEEADLWKVIKQGNSSAKDKKARRPRRARTTRRRGRGVR